MVKAIQHYLEQRKLHRQLLAKLETLTDPTLIERMTAAEAAPYLLQ
jgi:hypothetical protein